MRSITCFRWRRGTYWIDAIDSEDRSIIIRISWGRDHHFIKRSDTEPLLCMILIRLSWGVSILKWIVSCYSLCNQMRTRHFPISQEADEHTENASPPARQLKYWHCLWTNENTELSLRACSLSIPNPTFCAVAVANNSFVKWNWHRFPQHGSL